VEITRSRQSQRAPGRSIKSSVRDGTISAPIGWHAADAGACHRGVGACGGILKGVIRHQQAAASMSCTTTICCATHTAGRLCKGRCASITTMLIHTTHLMCRTRMADLRSCSHLCRDDHLSGGSFTSCCDKQLSGATVPHSRAYCRSCSTPQKRLHTSGRLQMPVLLEQT
jgi:hypothetical protein